MTATFLRSALQETDLQEISSAIRGEIINPGDATYDVARKIYNGMIDRRPALIVRAADESDVISTIRLARERQVDLSVRGGGHNVAGFGTNDGGIVLDLSLIRNVR